MRDPESFRTETDEIEDTELDVDDESPLEADPTVTESLAQGRKGWTPFALTGIVAITLWSFAALVCALLFAVWSLA